VIESILWDWETHATGAPGSDLWPVAWGPDDHLYAAWGDGGGFNGSDSDGRVAMGFARIEGGPQHWRGANVNGGKSPEHPASFPRKGKTTGVAFVDGVLYATVNLEDGPWPDVNHTLAWSTNSGATWTTAEWLFAKGTGNFQPAKFLTFGRDYTGLPGSLAGYVYLYGPRQSADRGSGNRLYLARAPRARLRECAAYEFFHGVDAAGTPVWVADGALAQPVFVDPNGVTPGSVVYHPGLRRYLLTCFHVGPGQLGVFDAPSPWGPWTTIAYHEDWGQMGAEGEGLTCGFPQKWMSADGLTLWSIFSVYGEGARKGVNAHDRFNLVRASLRLGPQESTAVYYPPPESAGGWRTLDNPEDIRRLAGAEPSKLSALKTWLLASDDRNFAAVVIRHGYLVLEVERGNSAKTDARRVASVSKAICATVLAIASEHSQQGLTPRKIKFDDRAFDFIPWAQPLSDPRKAMITVKQLLNHTSGLCPESTGAPNDGPWEYILGHSGDERTARLAFAPGTGSGYSTHALAHAALVCETVTGRPHDQFAVQALFKPLGIEHWWFQYYDGGEKYGRHPSHGLGMPARDLARIAYCMLRDGRWKDQQVIPKWFVDQTATPGHEVKTPELRWKLNPQVFTVGWELPARHWAETGRSGEGIPADARAKCGSGGQFIAFVPSLDLVITRQTGSSGDWAFEEYLRRACATVINPGE
jgi:CubicO group peptidase (beta-lactamase class C family)